MVGPQPSLGGGVSGAGHIRLRPPNGTVEKERSKGHTMQWFGLPPRVTWAGAIANQEKPRIARGKYM